MHRRVSAWVAVAGTMALLLGSAPARADVNHAYYGKAVSPADILTFFTGKWHLGESDYALPTAQGYDEMKAVGLYHLNAYTYADPTWFPDMAPELRAMFEKVTKGAMEGTAGQPAREMFKINGQYGKSFDPAKVDPVIRQALQTAPAASQKALTDKWANIARKANGWAMNTDSGVYGANYLKRGAVARFEIGINLPEDSIHPDTAASPLDGRNKYVMHFEKGALPPVDEFWSVTIYDMQGFIVPNPTNRYTLGDRSNLTPNANGSLDIYLQSESPGADKESNWLPTPAQPFSLHPRLYSPHRAAIDGTWAMPAVEKVK